MPVSTDAPHEALTGLGPRLLRNLSWLSVSQVVGLAISVTTVSVLSRALGVEAFGAFNYAFAFLYFGLTLADPGLTTTLVRDVAQTPERAAFLLQRAMGLKLSLAVAATVLSWAAAWVWLDEPVRSACMILGLIVPVQALSLPGVVLQARVQVKRGVVVELLSRVTGFAAMMTAVAAGWGLSGVVGGLVIGEMAGVAAMWAMTRAVVSPRPRIDVAVWRQLLRASLTVGGAGLLSALVNRLDFVMLEAMSDLSAVGYYGAAYRLPMLLERLPLLALATVFPLMARLAAEDRSGLKPVYRWALARAAVVAAPVVLVVLLGAPWILEWWTGPEFLPAVPALRWLILSTGCMYLAVVAGNLLIAMRRARISLAIWAIAAPLNVALNWWWIPVYGPTGAAAATFVTFLLVLAASLAAAERELAR